MGNAFKRLASLLLLLASMGLGLAEAAKPPKAYDFQKPEERYRWYQDTGKYIGKSGGLRCRPGSELIIDQSGKFSIRWENKLLKPGTPGLTLDQTHCLESVKNKHYPLPANMGLTTVVFPIRPMNSKPLTQAELDQYIFRMGPAK